MSEPSEQLKREIVKKVKPALDILITELDIGKPRKPSQPNTRMTIESYHIDKDDIQELFDAISIERVECVDHVSLNIFECKETNDTKNE